MKNGVANPTKKPSIYIDTCIARDITENRRDASFELIHRIKSGNWKCNMSIFGLMELVDIEQENIFVKKKYFIEKLSLDEVYSKRRNRDLDRNDCNRSSKYIEKFLDAYSFIELIRLDDKNWTTAIMAATYSNLDASDVIHLVSAYQADCDVIVTDDTFFISEAKAYLEKEGILIPRICKPEDCLSVLGEMGFTHIK